MQKTIKDKIYSYLLGKDWVASGTIEKQYEIMQTKPSTIDRLLRDMREEGILEKRQLDHKHSQYRIKVDYAPLVPKDDRSIYDVARELRMAKEEKELCGQMKLFT